MYMYMYTTGSSANPEVSSTDDSATSSVVPTVAFTSSTLANFNVEEVVIDQDCTAITTVTTPSADLNSSETSKRGTPMSTRTLFQSPSRKQSFRMRESCYMLKTPPLNLVMENVSEYIDSDEAWLSDGFYSHQIGYRICLAIKLESSSDKDSALNVMLGMISAEGMHSSYLVYPCSGFATVAILNPQANSDHKVLELMFILEKPTLNNCSEIVSEMVQVPRHFITQKDCIFFQMDRVEMDESKQKLWLLDAALVETVDTEHCTGGESSEEEMLLIE